MSMKPPAAVGMALAQVDTPALIIDLDAFERNLRRMADAMAQAGVRLRAHAKTHKSPIIAAQQMALGAVGVCCQKVSEAEVMVDGGIGDVLVSNEVAGAAKLERLAALARRARVGVCVDDAGNVADLEAAAARAGVRLDVLVEIDVGGSRCGVAPGAPAVHLASRVAASPHLRFAGLQAYHGSAQHVREAGARRDHIARAVELVEATQRALREVGLEAGIIAGGGTGTYENEAASRVYNELQCGSYIFMDADYARNKRADGGFFDAYEHALFVYRDGDEHAGAGARHRRCRPEDVRRRQRHAVALAAARCRLPASLRRARRARPVELHGATQTRRQGAAGARPLRSDRQSARLVRRRARLRHAPGACREPLAGCRQGRGVLISFGNDRSRPAISRPLRCCHRHPI